MSARGVASAPGKLILMGEHAAVYGRPAVVAALGLRTRVEIEAAPGGVELDLETLGQRRSLDWEAIDSYARDYGERWRRFDRSPSAGAFADLADPDPARVVKLALGETRRSAGLATRSGARVRVISEIPVGSGLGSSASVAVAVAGALLAFEGVLAPGAAATALDPVAGIALEVERRQHGRPSGVDHTTALRGGILGFLPGADFTIEPVPAGAAALAELRVFDTGRPAEATGEVVAAVRSLADTDPEGFGRRLDEMERATRAFIAALALGEPGERLRPIRAFERQLEALGVVPERVMEAVRAVESRGGAAKISGAGTRSGEAAGALLVAWPGDVDGAPGDALPGYPCLRSTIGAPGLEIEELT